MCACRGMDEAPGCDHGRGHEWFIAAFSYASWTECTCGYRPQSQEDMDAHVSR